MMQAWPGGETGNALPKHNLVVFRALHPDALALLQARNDGNLTARRGTFPAASASPAGGR